jgi:glyoxylase-like metal-dependent hydrolase (beta-lactamase superfamily II)
MKKICFTFILSVIITSLSAQQSPHFDLIKLSDGIYAAIHKQGGHAICNAGIIDLGKETLIFDTFMTPQAAEDLVEAVEALELSPIKYVINSHHHNDHVRGNQVFDESVAIFSAAQTRALMEKHESTAIEQEKSYAPQRYASLQEKVKTAEDPIDITEIEMWLGYYEGMMQSHPILVTTLPNFTFENQFNFFGASRNIELLEFLDGHTPSDVVMYLPAEKILFTGDLLFVKCHPYLGDGNLDQWIQTLEMLKEMDVKKYIPGHGPAGQKEDLNALISYINHIKNLVEEGKEKGMSLEAITALPIPEAFQDWEIRSFYELNLKILYR